MGTMGSIIMDGGGRDCHASLMQNLKRQVGRFGAPMAPKMFELLRTVRGPTAKLAAILIPLFLKDGDLHVLLTRRSPHMRFQPGDVCCPGGSWEEQDNDEIDTCLREAHEEIGLQPHLVNVLGKMYPTNIRDNHTLTPVIGVIPSHIKFKPNEEVDVVFSLPLRRFLSNSGHRQEQWTFGDKTYPLEFFDDEVDGKTITTWGMTAHTCIRLAIAVFQKQPEFPTTYHYTDPFKENRLRYENDRVSYEKLMSK